MKKMFSLALALIMALALCVPAFAVNVDDSVNAGDDTTGSITVNNPDEDETYDLYRLLDLESYNKDAGAYAYKLNNTWKDFFNQATIKDVYVNIDAQEYVTWIAAESAAAEFAKMALAYAEKNKIDPDCTGSTTYDNIALGYYLMDSSLGTLCSLTTTNNVVEITEKNAEPTIVKEVQEDSTEKFGENNTADIGQTVTFKATITAQEGAHNYVMHDVMSEGLTYIDVTSVTLGGTEIDAENYTVKTEGICAGCTFEVVFAQAFCDTLKDEDSIVVTYTAQVNENAVIAGTGNDNKVKLAYGDESETEWDTTITYTYSFDLVKTTSDGTILNGAQFELYDAATEGNKVSLVKVSEGLYRVATPEEVGAQNFVSAIIDAGQATIKGLDTDKYYLQETKAPDGYNMLPARVEISINDASITAVDVNEDGKYLADNSKNEDETMRAADTGVLVINLTGAELPTTGGIGTTIFYTVGGLMMAAAVVLFVTKKKLAVQE